MTTDDTDVPTTVTSTLRMADAEEFGLLVCAMEDPEVLAGNETIRSRLGMDEDDIVGADLGDILTGVPQLDDWSGFTETLDVHSWQPVTGRYTRAEGSQHPVRIDALAVRDDGVRPHVLVRTQRRDADGSTPPTMLERQFEAVFEHPASFVGLLDPDGTLRRVNGTALAFADAQQESVAGVSFWETPWWNHSPAVQAELRDRIERAADGEFQRFEAEHVGPDGETAIVDASLTPVEDEDGTVTGLVAVGRDVTERKQRERQLERQNSRIEALHGVATDIGACETTDAVFELIVEAAEEILEFDIAIADRAAGDKLVPMAVSSELDDENYFQETPIDDEENVAAQVYRSGDPSIDNHVPEQDVDPASTEFRSGLTVPIGDFGVFQSVDLSVGAFDETDLELTETLTSHAATHLERISTQEQLRDRTRKLEHQNDRLEQFTSVASHDLRNPLNVARGRVERARAETDSEHLDEAVAALDRSLALIDDLLTLAREGKQASNLDSISLTETVHRCWRNVETGGASLVVDTDQQIRADPSRLKQLLENLFRNSVEHGSTDSRAEPGDSVEHGSTSNRSSEESDDSVEHGSTGDQVGEIDGNGEVGEETVTITVGDVDDGFYVADDGQGIPADERDRVFEAGYSTSSNGTGFGLNIVHGIADAHDWDVRITESDGGGARFEFSGIDSS